MAGVYDPDFNCHAEIGRLRMKIERLETLEGIAAEKRKYEDQNTALRNRADLLGRRLSSARGKLADGERRRKDSVLKIAELRKRIREADAAIIRYVDTIAEKDREIEELRARLAKTEAELTENSSSRIRDLEAQLRKALGRNSQLETQAGHDYTNSSIPSSMCMNHRKISNSREKTGRKPGGQPGHPGHRRRDLPPDRIQVLPDPEEASSDPDIRPTGRILSKKVADLVFRVDVIEYQAREFRNTKTGRILHAAFPGGISDEITYGPAAKSVASLLNNCYNVSIEKVGEFLSLISGGAIRPSNGMINELAASFSTLTEHDRMQARERLLASPAVNIDFTGARMNGENKAIMVTADKDSVLYLARDHKGHQGIDGTFIEEYRHTLIHDHDRSFYDYGESHQECLAHILRYLQDSIEMDSSVTWHAKMKGLLTGIIHDVKSDPGTAFSAGSVRRYEEEYDALLDLAKKEYGPFAKVFANQDGMNLYKRLREYKDATLYFLHHPEVDWTNNRAERELRTFKRKMKQVGAFRSKKSLDDFCSFLSFIENARLNNQGILDCLMTIFQN